MADDANEDPDDGLDRLRDALDARYVLREEFEQKINDLELLIAGLS